MASSCTHLDYIRNIAPSSRGCEDCLKTGDTWVHVQLCLTCGHVGCCDSSKNKHAEKHFRAAAGRDRRAAGRILNLVLLHCWGTLNLAS